MSMRYTLKQYIDKLCAELEKVEEPPAYALGVHLVSLDSGLARSAQLREAINHVYLRLIDVIKSKDFIVPWTPISSASELHDLDQHFQNLQIPTVRGRPSLLLHRLGEPGAFALEDPASRAERLQSVFLTARGGLKHSVLFNTSGAGKTRLVLDGLCGHWGFYFTCNSDVNECGSADLQHVLDPGKGGYLIGCGLRPLPREDPSFLPGDLEKNQHYATRCFMATLTARVLVFQCLLAVFEECGNKPAPAVLRRIWLFTQIDLSILERPDRPDVFLELTTLLCYMPEYNKLQRYTPAMLQACRSFIRAENLASEPGATYIPLFCVVDEAQTAAEAFPKAFRGTRGSRPMNDEDHNSSNEAPCRPALRQLLNAWDDLTLHFIVTGTSLAIEAINDSISSTIAKEGVSNFSVQATGSHVDTKEQILRYLEYYLPPGHIDTPSGKELLERAQYWLFGRQVLFKLTADRPRFIASYVQYLAANKFQCCHRLLTKYIYAITNCFTPRDAEHWEALEGPLPETTTAPPSPFDFGPARLNSNLLDAVLKIVNYRLISGSLDFDRTGEAMVQAELVECGFARFSIQHQGIFDEPLAYLAADFHLNSSTSSKYSHFLQHITQHSSYDKGSNGLERYTAICLGEIFQDFTKLSAYFDFANINNTNGLSNRKARLVSCWKDSSGTIRTAPVKAPMKYKCTWSSGKLITGCGAESPSSIFCYSSINPQEDIKWLQCTDERRAPILFPNQSFGPDLLFRLQLKDSLEIITVALQVKLRADPKELKTPDGTRTMARTVTPCYFWVNSNGGHHSHASYPELRNETMKALEDLPGRYNKDRPGYLSVLRSVAIFPALQGICQKINLNMYNENRMEQPFEDPHHEFCVMRRDLFVKAAGRLMPDKLIPGNSVERLEAANRRAEAERKPRPYNRPTNTKLLTKWKEIVPKLVDRSMLYRLSALEREEQLGYYHRLEPLAMGYYITPNPKGIQDEGKQKQLLEEAAERFIELEEEYELSEAAEAEEKERLRLSRGTPMDLF